MCLEFFLTDRYGVEKIESVKVFFLNFFNALKFTTTSSTQNRFEWIENKREIKMKMKMKMKAKETKHQLIKQISQIINYKTLKGRKTTFIFRI